jgi:hypothetical protein
MVKNSADVREIAVAAVRFKLANKIAAEKTFPLTMSAATSQSRQVYASSHRAKLK